MVDMDGPMAWNLNGRFADCHDNNDLNEVADQRFSINGLVLILAGAENLV